MSGFVKTPVSHRVAVGLLGLDGDEQADLRVHGGRDKAVYGYAWVTSCALARRCSR
jgi:MOSC domain-containing protein YiiM